MSDDKENTINGDFAKMEARVAAALEAGDIDVTKMNETLRAIDKLEANLYEQMKLFTKLRSALASKMQHAVDQGALKDGQGRVLITGHDVRALRKAYDSAIKDGRSSFNFKGHVILVDYAKYLLQYIEAK